MRNKKNNKIKRKALISSFEILVLITAIFAFAYLISTPEIVSAAEIPKGCCPEAKSGAVCQDMNKLDEGMCKTSLVATSCQFYEPCKKGCCYNPSEGLCSPNSPKDKCEKNSGNWTSDAECSTAKCALGCCVLGTQAPMTTSRECSKLSGEYGFTKNFQAIDSSNGCFGYTNLEDEGACVRETGEYAPFECSFTTKKQCLATNGKFYKNLLCTNIDLNTACVPTVQGKFKTSCIENKDQIYFIDSCGNKANIYDSSRAQDPEYWKTVIPAAQSCASSPNSASCGNCDILAGSTCEQYRIGKDAKPDMGNNICRDLNCNSFGKKHGESWCVGEYDTSIFGVAPVGSRNFKAICMDGEVSIEQCADFNQEVCLQQSSGSFSEAQCVMNDWRACMSANEVGGAEDITYDDVKEACDKLPQCAMFNDIPGETTASDAYDQEGMKGFPGFRKTDKIGNSIENIAQAKYNDVGKDYNKVIPWCVPKYTPGLQFWTNANNQSSSGGNSGSAGNSNQQSNTGMGYGGSTAETTAICSMGNFICVGGEKKSKLFGSFKEDENIICITDGSKKDDVPVYLDTLNERCRMLGSCGAYVNIVGQLGSNAEDLNNNNTKLINRGKIGADGSYSKEKGSTDKYSAGYLESLSSKPGYYLALQDFAGTNTGGTVPSGAASKFSDIISNLQNAAKVDENVFAKYAPSTIGSIGALTGNLLDLAIKLQKPGIGGLPGTNWMGDTVAKQAATNQLAVASTKAAASAAEESAKQAATAFSNAEKGLEVAQLKLDTSIAETTKAISTGDNAAYVRGMKNVDAAKQGVDAAKQGVETTKTAAETTAAKSAEATTKASDAVKNVDKTSMATQLITTAVIIAITIILGILLDKWDPIGGGMSPGDKSAVYSMATSAAGALLTASAWALGLLAMGPVGWVLLVIGLIVAVVMQFFMYKTENQYYIMQYTCAPWEPPLDGQCDVCNKNALIPCSDYRCRSLGADCQYFNQNGEPGTCAKITDTSSATIKPWPEALTTPYAYSDVQEMKFTINDVEAYTGIQFGVITDKSAKCKIDTKHTAGYDEMAFDMLSSTTSNGLAGYNHLVALSPYVTSASSSSSESSGTGTTDTSATAQTTSSTSSTVSTENSVATLPLITGVNNYYIRCKNYAGNWNRAEFIARVIVKEGPDATAPIITKFIPPTNSYVGYGMNTTIVQFYTNEPSECKYSKDYNLAYNDMIGTTTCVGMAVLGEFACFAILNVSAVDSSYYFKCKDLSPLGNLNDNAYPYSLKSCQTGLNITLKGPSGEIKIGSGTANVELYLKTIGCVNGGEAVCKYNLGSGFTDFYSTDSTEHSQTFEYMASGEYNIPVSCTDIARNTVSDTVRFNVTIADYEPIVIFAGKSGGVLKIVTSESAECRYAGNNTESCSFNFEDGIGMTNSGTQHTTQYTPEKTYYIKCKSMFNVTNSGCGIIVRPGE